MQRAISVLCTTAVIASCGDGIPSEPRDVPQAGNFTTDFTSYTAQQISSGTAAPVYAVRIVTRFSNTSAQPVYLERCYPNSTSPIYSVDLLGQTDSWGAAYNPVWACVGVDAQILVAPGASRVDTLHLLGPNAFDGKTAQGFGVTSGRFRLSYFPLSCSGVNAEIRCEIKDATLRVSNEFTIRLP